jgi:hypothetical protein
MGFLQCNLIDQAELSLSQIERVEYPLNFASNLQLLDVENEVTK